MSQEKVIVSSTGGEVRIEAEIEDGIVCFRTFILNDHQPSVLLGGEPPSKLSVKGVASYFAHKKNEIRELVRSKTSLAGRVDTIFQQLIADMQ